MGKLFGFGLFVLVMVAAMGQQQISQAKDCCVKPVCCVPPPPPPVAVMLNTDEFPPLLESREP
jgi:hypothetical protein